MHEDDCIFPIGPAPIHHEDDPLFGSSFPPMHEEDAIFPLSNNHTTPPSGAVRHVADTLLVDDQDTSFADTLRIDDTLVVDDTLLVDDFADTLWDEDDVMVDAYVTADDDGLDGSQPVGHGGPESDADGLEPVQDLNHVASGSALGIEATVQEGPLDAFNLDMWLQDSLRVPAPCPTDSSKPADDTFDSQLTQNENPGVSSQPTELPPPPSHFTQQKDFWDKVAYRLHGLLGQPWLGEAPSLDRLTPDFQRNADVCAQSIQHVISSATHFKIGITCDPRWRFFECDDGDYAKNFDKMVLVYAAETSKPKKMDSTGMMEIEQIARFKHLPGCENVSGGGDRPSEGSPHFMYVVYR